MPGAGWVKRLRQWLMRLAAALAVLLAILAAVRGLYQPPAPAAPKDLRAIPNYGHPKRIELTWTDASTDEHGFKIYRATSSGPPPCGSWWSFRRRFDMIHTVSSQASEEPMGRRMWADVIGDETREYYYVVAAYRSVSIPEWLPSWLRWVLHDLLDGDSDLTPPAHQNVKIVWPVWRSVDDKDQINNQILHNWNERIGMANTAVTGFHAGVDIQRIETRNTVTAVRGGVVQILPDGADSKAVLVEVKIEDETSYDETYHLEGSESDEATVDDGDIVAAGDPIGVIAEQYFTPDFLDHVHYAILDEGQSIADLHPLSIFEEPEHLDPGQTPPVLKEHFESPGDFKVRRAESGDFLSEVPGGPSIAHDDVDIIAEVADRMGSELSPDGGIEAETFDQLPVKVGYWIEAPAGDIPGLSFHDVMGPDAPYVLFDGTTEYLGRFAMGEDELSSWIAVVEFMLPEYNVARNLRRACDADPGCSRWDDYTWDNYKHLIVTNASGTKGAAEDVDDSQCWRTNAEDDNAEDDSDHANYAGKPTALKPTKARFPDGVYTIHVIAGDLIQETDITCPAGGECRRVRLENFPPIVCASGLTPNPTAPSHTGTIVFSEAMDTSVDAADVVSIGNGARIAEASWVSDGAELAYVISDLRVSRDYTLTVLAGKAKDLPPSPGGRELDGDGNGTAGDDYQESFTVTTSE